MCGFCLVSSSRQLDAEPEGIAIEDLVPHLVETIVTKFGGAVKPAFEARDDARAAVVCVVVVDWFHPTTVHRRVLFFLL